MLNTFKKWFRADRQTEPEPVDVYNPPWSDWTDVLSRWKAAERAVKEYAKRTDLPLGVRRSFDMAVEQIEAGKWHDLMRMCRRSVHDQHYEPCCSHVSEALAARELTTAQS